VPSHQLSSVDVAPPHPSPVAGADLPLPLGEGRGEGASEEQRGQTHRRTGDRLAALAVATTTTAWIGLFGWLAVTRHLAGGTHAEDLGFTDQVLWNFLRGQWFRMSLYKGVTWNTELDLSHLARPDSLLAFHVEPLLLAFTPLYLAGAGPLLLLTVQAIAIGLGALPAFLLGRHFAHSNLAGLVTALAYLLSPFGQAAALADFHTSALAVPLLLLSAERLLVARAPKTALAAALAALTAREDVGPAVALLGVTLLLLEAPRRPALVMAAGGVVWTMAAGAVLLHYSGGVSPFGARYGESLGGGIAGVLGALTRPIALQPYITLLLSGGWLAVVAPAAVLGAVPALAANALSSSSWMASSSAHYGVLLPPSITLCVAVALRRFPPRLIPVVLLPALIGYLSAGYGPLAPNYAPAYVTPHAQRAFELAAALPADVGVSASSTLVPHLSHRARLYLFPSVLDADYVYLDLHATSAPTSPGDVFLRTRDMLRGGGWRIDTFSDGLLLLHRDDTAPPIDLAPPSGAPTEAAQSEPRLLDAALVPSPEGALDVDGPRWILRTTWQTDRQLPAGTRLDVWLDLSGPQQVHVWDIADTWWLPPERWIPGQPVIVDIPDVPLRRFVAWRAVFTTPP